MRLSALRWQLAAQNQNRLVVEAEANLGALSVDAMRLRQIRLNLLSNACMFTGQDEVALRARKVADGPHWIELAVAGHPIRVFPDIAHTFLRLAPRRSTYDAVLAAVRPLVACETGRRSMMGEMWFHRNRKTVSILFRPTLSARPTKV